jgi:hypothetical protein
MERINVSNERQSMIYPEQLRPFHVGQWVEYRGTELGRIKSWSSRGRIFVVFHCDGKWQNYQNYTAAAVDPNDLNFIHRPRGIACSPSYAESSLA